MTAPTCKITLHMVSSLDGFVARHDESIEWLDTADNYEEGVVGTDPGEFLKSIDCYVMGAHTYELAIRLARTHGWPYGDTHTIVLTHRELPSERDSVSFFSGDIEALTEDVLNPRFRNVWVVGGPIVVAAFLRQRLAAELKITILPILLGDGKPFFQELTREQPMHLHDVVAYRNGMVELTYRIPGRKDPPSPV